MSTRMPYAIGLIAVTSLLLTSLYYQFFQGIMPCPLCTLQRLNFVLLGIVFLMGLIFQAKRTVRLLISFLSILFSSVGIALAGRQVWLQHFPNGQANECGVSLQYMMQALPLNEVMQKIFQGSAECTQRGWEFLHLNMAEWALIWFGIFMVLSVYLIVTEIKNRS